MTDGGREKGRVVVVSTDVEKSALEYALGRGNSDPDIRRRFSDAMEARSRGEDIIPDGE